MPSETCPPSIDVLSYRYWFFVGFLFLRYLLLVVKVGSIQIQFKFKSLLSISKIFLVKKLHINLAFSVILLRVNGFSLGGGLLL